MNVIYHLGVEHKALIKLLQETHSTSLKKLPVVVPSFALVQFSLNWKHGLAMFVHKRLKYALLKQSRTTSGTEKLCVDVDERKIVKV